MSGILKQILPELETECPYVEAGWIPPEKRSRAVNELAIRVMRDIYQPGNLVVAQEDIYVADDDARLEHGVFFFELERQLYGQDLFPWTQKSGDCVSFGAAGACNDLLTINHLVSGGLEIKLENTVATEPIYAGSRIEIGDGRLGRGAGSLGEWAIAWLMKFGVILRDNYGSIDLSQYDVRKADGWGAPGRGCPDELESIAKQHPVTDSAAVKDGRTAISMLVNLNPITVASDMGFESRRRENGICRPQGSWAHQMFLRGAAKLKDGNNYVPIQNSWGDYLGSSNDEVETYSGRKVKLPPGCFMAAVDDIERRMLAGGDSHAIRSMTGWKASSRARSAMERIAGV